MVGPTNVSRLMKLRAIDEEIERLSSGIFLNAGILPGNASDEIKKWENSANRNDNDTLFQWNAYLRSMDVAEGGPGGRIKMRNIDEERLCDGKRVEVYAPLKKLNWENSNKWTRGGKCSKGRQAVVERQRKFYPFVGFRSGCEMVGFEFLSRMETLYEQNNPSENIDTYTDSSGVVFNADCLEIMGERADRVVFGPENRDTYGTRDNFYFHTEVALAMKGLISERRSPKICLTIIGPGFAEFNQDDTTPVVPDDGKCAEDEAIDVMARQGEGMSVDTGDGTASVSVGGASSVSDPVGANEDPAAASASEEAGHIPEEMDCTTLMKMQTMSLPECGEGRKTDEQIRYVTGWNMSAYIEKLVKSHAFQSASKLKSFSCETRLRRICAYVLVKAHCLILVWDTLLGSAGEFIQHRVYVCQNLPQDEYWYKSDYEESRLNDTVLRHFISACQAEGYLRDAPLAVFNDTAFRTTMRFIFLRSEEHGDDMACVTYMMICSVYLSMIENAVTVEDKTTDAGCRSTGGRRFVFSTYPAKRFFRFHIKCFQEHARHMLREEIEGRKRCVWASPSMQAYALNINDIDILTVDPSSGERITLKYNGYRDGFVRGELVCKGTRGSQK